VIALIGLALLDALLLIFAVGQSSLATVWHAPLHVIATMLSLRLAYAYLERVAGWQSLALPISVAVGPCGILVLIILQIRNDKGRTIEPRRSNQIEQESARPACMRSPSFDMAKLLDARVRFPAAEEVQSLATILRHGNFPARQGALEAAIRSFEPRLSPLIAAALADKDPTIRALAAAACAQISNNLAQRLAHFEQSGGSSLDDELEFGTLLSDHATFNQLLPDSRRAQLRGQACEIFERCLEAIPADDQREVAARERLITLRKQASAGALVKPALQLAE
jgi:hypothetical protein